MFRILSNILLLVFVGLCLMIANTYRRTYQVKVLNENLTEVRRITQKKESEQDEKESDWSKGMLEINPDYTGWLTVYGTQVDGPVVFSGDNERYMRRAINGKWALGGTLFLDGDTRFETDGNRIIYGHKMKDDTMFGSLDLFKDHDFFDENGIVRWEDVEGTHYYKIFALMVLPGSSTQEGYIDIRQWCNDLGESESDQMIEMIRSKASIFRESRFTEDDRYLFLVTCDYTKEDGRLVLVSKRM